MAGLGRCGTAEVRVGLSDRLKTAASDHAYRRGYAYQDPELDRLTEETLEKVMPIAKSLGPDAWTNDAEVWRSEKWPGDTINRYSAMVSQWIDEVVPRFLDTLEYGPKGPTWNASARLAANRLRGPRFRHLPAEQRNNAWRILLALDEYGHPFACEDAQMGLWCAGMCDADWRQHRYSALPEGGWSRTRPGNLRMFPHIPWMRTTL